MFIKLVVCACLAVFPVKRDIRAQPSNGVPTPIPNVSEAPGALGAYRQATAYVNSVLPGHHPIPLKMRGDFYHYDASLHFIPYPPLYRSRRPVHRKMMNSVARPAKANFGTGRSSASIWHGAITHFCRFCWRECPANGQPAETASSLNRMDAENRYSRAASPTAGCGAPRNGQQFRQHLVDEARSKGTRPLDLPQQRWRGQDSRSVSTPISVLPMLVAIGQGYAAVPTKVQPARNSFSQMHLSGIYRIMGPQPLAS